MKKKLILELGIWAFMVASVFGGELYGKVTLLNKDASDSWKPALHHGDVVVFVIGFQESPEQQTWFLDQMDKSFSPKILAVSQGQSVIFRNKDPIHHNVFSLSKTKNFDLGLYKDPETKTVSFDRPGLVKVFCNIHAQMISTILVLQNNKYAVTHADGIFRIQNIPTGSYKIRAWAEGSDLSSQDVTITATSKEEIRFELQLRTVQVNHLNKYGKPYKSY